MKLLKASVLLAAVVSSYSDEFRATIAQRLSNLRQKDLSIGGLKSGRSLAKPKHDTSQNGRRLIAPAATGVPAQRFFVPLPENDLMQQTFKKINNVANGDVNSIIAISVSTDGTLIAYDHWEDGYEVDPSNPAQSTTEIWGDGDISNGCAWSTCTSNNDDVLNAGDSIVLNNKIPSSHGTGSPKKYDGRDLIEALYPIAVTRGAYPDTPGSLMAGAVEVFDTSYWGREYVAPLSRGTSSYTSAFEHVGLYFMAKEDNTTVTGSDGVNFNLDMGESKFLSVASRGTVYTSDNPVQVVLVTGDEASTYELRWYSLRPYEQWAKSYLSPMGDSTGQTRIVVYNPHNTKLTVTYDGKSGRNTLSIDPNNVQWTKVIATGSACYLSAEKPFIAFSVTDTKNSGELFDWGFPVMPTDMLSSVAFIGWGYGCTDNVCNHGGKYEPRSKVWVSPIRDATVWVDYDNDGVADDNWNVDYLNGIIITQKVGNDDMSGAVIWATERGAGKDGDQVAIAAAWGQDPSASFSNDADALDLGTVVVPFTPISATKDAALVNDLRGDGVIGRGDTIKYTIELMNVGPGDIGSGKVSIQDTLDPNVVYVAGSTVYFDHNGASYIIQDGGGFPLDGAGITNKALLPRISSGGSHFITFDVTIKNDAGTDLVTSIYNSGLASIWGNKATFDNLIRLPAGERSTDIILPPEEEEECPPDEF